MARTLSKFSIALLNDLGAKGSKMLHDLYKSYSHEKNEKEIYNTLYRLSQQGYVEISQKLVSITSEGHQLIHKLNPKKDGVWKLIIFDIPESQRYVRNFLRAKLQSLGFKKWQNSIWISPYELDPEIETELNDLAKKFFVRLIRTTSINHTTDLETMFKE